jgi:AraC-like DNA-binding protein
VRLLISNAIAERGQRQTYSDELLCSIFQQILIYIIRGFQTIEPPKHSAAATQADILCHKLMNYIDTHIYTIKKLTEIADALNYNYSYLSNLFRVTTGRSIMDYFYERRLDLAKTMILDQKMSITKVADKLNYPSLYSFSRMFKNRYGCSPDAYRKANTARPAHAEQKDEPKEV